MNRIASIIFCILITVASVSAQPGKTWTSKNKRAVKHHEKAMENYRAGRVNEALDLSGKAIKADSSFIEAYMLMAEIAMDRNNNAMAIFAMEYVVAIDQLFFPPYLFHLGTLYIEKEEYGRALHYLNRYMALPSNYKGREILTAVENAISSCHFAIESMKNPVNFNPINLGEGVNSELDEYFPSLTVDEMTLLFTRQDRDRSNQDGWNENLYISNFKDYLWQPAKSIGSPVNTRYNEGASAISPDGQIIVFTSCELMRGMGYGGGRTGFGSCDLFFTYRTGNEWAIPQNLGKPVNTNQWESQPAFDASGKTLYFVRGVPTPGRGISNSDIYYTTFDDKGNWSVPKALGPNINTPGNEEGVFIHPDGQTLYFSSDGHPGMGGYDIFMSRRMPNGEWGTAVNLGYPINTSKNELGFIVSPSGKHAYFSSNREGGYGGQDIYSFELDPSLRPYPVTYLKGVVYDSETTKPLSANFELIDLATGATVVSSFSDPVTGDFLISLPTDKAYALNVNREKYLFYSDHFELKGSFSVYKPFIKDIPLQPVKTGESVVLRNIFFDHDQFILKQESMSELLRLAELLKQNPGISIEIGGHTDNTGTRRYNETLSDNRAKAVKDFLISQGIDASRLSHKGYADLVPIADNSTAEGRSQNRRTEFRITAH